jgi:chromate transporter
LRGIIRPVSTGSTADTPLAPLRTLAREWTRIGVTGFGGPPAHIALLRKLVVERMGWMNAEEFQDANAACGLLPGPSSTQLAIFCAYRVGGPVGAIVGGLGFVVPAVVAMMLLSPVFLAHAPPTWVRGAGAGAGAAVAAVAVQAARGLIGPSWQSVRVTATARRLRWGFYIVVSAVAAAVIGPYLVLVLFGCGAFEVLATRPRRPGLSVALLPAKTVAVGGYGALAWTALKIGALAFGGGFVIVPLMQDTAVHVYHWMSNSQFLSAVALGQITPGPVVATIAAVGYAAHGLLGAAVAAVIAFAPSFSFVLIGGARFNRLRSNASARAFLDGAGPAAIGAILGGAVLLGSAVHFGWQFGLLAAAAIALLVFNRGVVAVLLSAGVIGVVAGLAGAPLPH